MSKNSTFVPKWKLIVTRRVVPFRSFVMAEGSQDEMKKYLGVTNDCLVVNKDEVGKFCLKIADLISISKIVIDKIKADSNFPQQHVNDCLKMCGELVEVSKKCGGDALLTNNGVVLRELFEEYYKIYKKFVKFVVIPVAIEQALTKNITNFLSSKVDTEKINEYLNKLTTAPKLPETNQEQIDMVELVLKIQGRDTDKKRLLKEHYKKYCWLSCYNIDETPFDLNYYEDRLNELLALDKGNLELKLSDARQQLIDDENTFKQVVSELEIMDEMYGQAQLLREYVFLRSFRIEMQSKANYYIQDLFQSIGNNFGLDLRQIVALTPTEILNLFSSVLPDKKLLEERIKNYVLLSESGKIELYTDSEQNIVVERELGKFETGNVLSISGVSVYAGKVQGIVRIILKKEDLNNFVDDEILITTMTSPEMVLAMKKAKAMVTNEGGVLCHAAIVARELKIPCIIATQKATEIFKSGDYVEVDADVGLIKKYE